MMVCQVCPSGKRAEVDDGLLAGVPERTISKRTGLHASSIHRHRECIRTALKRAELSEARSIKGRVEKLISHLEKLADESAAEGKPGAQLLLQAARELRPTLTLMGQVNGEIASASVAALFQALGVSGEHEVRGALDVRRSMGSASIDDYEQEVLASIRFLVAEKPDFRTSALALLEAGSHAEVLPDNGNGVHP